MRSQSVRMYLVLAASVLALTGCGGGGGGGSSSSSGGAATALTVADKVSVVDAQSSPAGGIIVKGLKIATGLASADLPSNSDYFNDRQSTFVADRAADSFDTLNYILCVMGQTRYDSMVNQGPYKAQIDQNKCESDNDSASSAGSGSQNQSSGSTAPDYSTWTVDSSRADGSSPHIVKVWAHEEADEHEPAKTIYVKISITEGTSSTNPYGIFTLNFRAVNQASGSEMFKGFLKSERDSNGKVLLKLANSGAMGPATFDEKVVLDRASDGSTGGGSTSMTETSPGGSESSNYNFAFNTSNFRRYNTATTDDACYSRTSFEETAWRYGLYGSSGSRVDIASGYPIKTADGAFGWIGYYGIWFPNNVTISNGDTVYKVAYGGSETPYTVLKVGGKLKKNTRHTATLSEIKNIPLDGWFESGTNYRVKWDATSQQFLKFATFNNSSNMWTNITEAAVDLSTVQYGELNFWSQALGGQVRVKLACSGWNNITGKPNCSAPGNSTSVIYFTEEAVFPGDTVPSTLRCFDNCPKYTVAASGIDPSSPSYANSYDPNSVSYHDYTFAASASGMVLKEGANSLVMTGSGSGQYQHGFMSGPLFEPSSANLTALACDWNPAQTCGWKAWSELSTYYTWETGSNPWNQFTALVSGGTPVRFDPPMQVTYTHTQTDSAKPDYKYNGVKFFLEYSGFGNLWGIPGRCIDPDTGAASNCSPSTRWVPEFSIADGSELSNSNTPSTKYLAKALEKEQRMTKVASSNCSSLSLTGYTLPSLADWTDPDIGSEPTVTSAPAVIGGVLQ